jgi:hypothetical protein
MASSRPACFSPGPGGRDMATLGEEHPLLGLEVAGASVTWNWGSSVKRPQGMGDRSTHVEHGCVDLAGNMVHACNPSYWGGGYQQDHGLKPE